MANWTSPRVMLVSVLAVCALSTQVIQAAVEHPRSSNGGEVRYRHRGKGGTDHKLSSPSAPASTRATAQDSPRCPPGTYMPHQHHHRTNTSVSPACLTCSLCGDGLYERRPCRAHHDVTCAACAAGPRGPRTWTFYKMCRLHINFDTARNHLYAATGTTFIPVKEATDESKARRDPSEAQKQHGVPHRVPQEVRQSMEGASQSEGEPQTPEGEPHNPKDGSHSTGGVRGPVHQQLVGHQGPQPSPVNVGYIVAIGGTALVIVLVGAAVSAKCRDSDDAQGDEDTLQDKYGEASDELGKDEYLMEEYQSSEYGEAEDEDLEEAEETPPCGGGRQWSEREPLMGDDLHHPMGTGVSASDYSLSNLDYMKRSVRAASHQPLHQSHHLRYCRTPPVDERGKLRGQSPTAPSAGSPAPASPSASTYSGRWELIENI